MFLGSSWTSVLKHAGQTCCSGSLRCSWRVVDGRWQDGHEATQTSWCWLTDSQRSTKIHWCRVMLEKEWKHGKGTAVFWWEGYLFRGLAHSIVNSTRPFPYVDYIQTGFGMEPWVFNWPSVSMHRHAQEQEGARQQKHPSGLVGLGLGQLNAVDWCWLYYSYTMLYLVFICLHMSLHICPQKPHSSTWKHIAFVCMCMYIFGSNRGKLSPVVVDVFFSFWDMSDFFFVLMVAFILGAATALCVAACWRALTPARYGDHSHCDHDGGMQLPELVYVTRAGGSYHLTGGCPAVATKTSVMAMKLCQHCLKSHGNRSRKAKDCW